MDMRSKSVYISKKLVVNIACEMNKKVLTFIFYVLKSLEMFYHIYNPVYACIESLLKYNYEQYEFFVINHISNGSIVLGL